jgi:anti-sigma B factor antagonist
VDLAVEQVNGVQVVTLAVDHLDAGNSREFKRALAPVLERGRRLILDLGSLRFVDSSGLGAILGVVRGLNDAGGELKLCNLGKQARLVFELVRMHRIVDIYHHRQEALASFAA